LCTKGFFEAKKSPKEKIPEKNEYSTQQRIARGRNRLLQIFLLIFVEVLALPGSECDSSESERTNSEP
jgi:hypothetical protein